MSGAKTQYKIKCPICSQDLEIVEQIVGEVVTFGTECKECHEIITNLENEIETLEYDLGMKTQECCDLEGEIIEMQGD